LLEQGGYAYFSPAVAWKMRDKETNKWVYNQITGGGITNDPYLGETTALMRRGLSFQKGGFLMGDNQKPNPQDELGLLVRGAVRLFRMLGTPVTIPGATPAGEGATIPPASVDVSELTSQVAELRQQVEQATGSISTLTTQRDTALKQVETLVGRVSTVEQARLVEQFRGMVASQFSHLPGTTDQLADELLWLFTLDAPTNGDDDTTRPHYAFFRELLTRADGQYQSAFATRGRITAPEGSIFEQVQNLIAKFKIDNKDTSDEAAQSAVFAANPQLYGQYLLELDNEEVQA
jgi:hypothetical protein